MTAAAVDLSDFALWRNGFPDELFVALRRVAASPFGLSLQGIRENPRRMPA